jgi:predicted enzyme related to lactoylglutathione lyase
MMTIRKPEPARFCWVDLAAIDAERAKSFYGALFGWRAQAQHAGDGHFTRFVLDGRDVASLYQLNRHYLAGGVPSHWTPYVAVTSAEETASNAVSLGAKILVNPFDVAGIARVCLIQDPIGALVGLWQQPE